METKMAPDYMVTLSTYTTLRMVREVSIRLERVQRRATKLIPELRILSYEASTTV